MDSYYDYLAAQVLNEKQIVTYRTVSRALKVHVNLAKQMLWDFHHRENARASGSVHATFLLMGQRRIGIPTSAKSSQRRDGDDIVMDSSPPLPGSSMPMSEAEAVPQSILQRTMALVKQDDLEEAKGTFEGLTSIHIYSLEADGLADFQLLTDCNRTVLSTLRTDDIMQSGKQYGMIQNPGVKRRTRKTPLPQQPASKAVPSAAVKQPGATTATTTTTKTSAPVKSTSKPPLLKQNSSGIAASFAKGASKPKAAIKPIEAPAATTNDVDAAMGGMSDDDDDADVEDQAVDIDTKAPTGKSKKDRQAELEAMMDAEDEVMDEPEQAAEEPSPEPAEEEPVKEEPKEEVTVENGRRRGRRRVMKKKTVRDEEGYLVTKEEAMWESFSEDEPVPKKVKTSSAPTTASKKANKPGQGNIMSFFSKK